MPAEFADAALPNSDGPRSLYRRVIGGFGLALVAATWKLWTGQTDFPRVPLVFSLPGVGPLPALPTAVDRCAGGLIVIGLISLLLPDRPPAETGFRAPTWRDGVRWVALCMPAGFLAAVLLDQHRLQPWAYQMAALCLLFVFLPSHATIRLARLLTVGIYAWSALGKLDFQFIHTVGAQLISTLLAFLRIDADQVAHQKLAHAALVLPIGELLVACMLIPRRLRRLGVIAAVAMHSTLILTLGPFGLDHEPGVLLWNGLFIGQAIVLFWPRQWKATSDAEASSLTKAAASPTTDPATVNMPPSGISWRSLAGTVMISLMLVLPFGERWGRWDHWLSWALYAPHSSRLQFWVAPRAVERLPGELQELMQKSPTNQWGWRAVPLDRWSLQTLDAPIYPQQRFQVGVVIAVVQQAQLDQQFSVELRDVSSRWSGQRQVRQLHSLDELRRAATAYRFNALPD